jgi:hypothetical protein
LAVASFHEQVKLAAWALNVPAQVRPKVAIDAPSGPRRKVFRLHLPSPANGRSEDNSAKRRDR